MPIIAVTVRDGEGTIFRAVNEDAPPDDDATEVEGVFLLDGGTAVWAPVSVGVVSDWYFEVLTGLEPGDTVIAGPYSAVRDLEAGDAVRTPATAGNEG